jgi:hypothetical protein
VESPCYHPLTHPPGRSARDDNTVTVKTPNRSTHRECRCIGRRPWRALVMRIFLRWAGAYEAQGKQEYLCYLEEFAVRERCLAVDRGFSSAACAIFRVRFETATDDREINSLSKTDFVPGIRGSRETRTQ